MPSYCISGQNAILIDLIQEQTGLTREQTLEEYADKVAKINNCGDPNSRLAPYTALVLPDAKDGIITQSSEARLTQVLPHDDRRLLYNTLDEIDPQDINGFIAIVDFAENNKKVLSDSNTFTGGGVATVTRRTGKFLEALQKLDKLLMESARTGAIDKAKVRTKIKAAYIDLNQQFGHEVELLTRKNGASNKFHPLRNPRSGWKTANRLARKGRSMPLLSQPDMSKLARVMRSAKWLGRGVLAVDLVSRGHTIYNSQNPSRAFFREAAGLSVSTGLAYATFWSGLAFALLLGPWGLLVVIIAAGAMAVAGDYAGKYLFDRYMYPGFAHTTPLISY